MITVYFSIGRQDIIMLFSIDVLSRTESVTSKPNFHTLREGAALRRFIGGHNKREGACEPLNVMKSGF